MRNIKIISILPYGYDDTIGIFENLFRIGDRNIHPKPRHHDKLF
jgi:hypothetical protein